jgi:predicted DNA binding protein
MVPRRKRVKESKPRKPGGGRKHKLTVRQMAAIQSSAASTKALAEKYGVSEMTIWNTRNKITLTTKGEKQ